MTSEQGPTNSELIAKVRAESDWTNEWHRECKKLADRLEAADERIGGLVLSLKLKTRSSEIKRLRGERNDAIQRAEDAEKRLEESAKMYRDLVAVKEIEDGEWEDENKALAERVRELENSPWDRWCSEYRDRIAKLREAILDIADEECCCRLYQNKKCCGCVARDAWDADNTAKGEGVKHG